MDAFTISWNNLAGYLFPPFTLLSRLPSEDLSGKSHSSANSTSVEDTTLVPTDPRVGNTNTVTATTASRSYSAMPQPSTSSHAGCDTISRLGAFRGIVGNKRPFAESILSYLVIMEKWYKCSVQLGMELLESLVSSMTT